MEAYAEHSSRKHAPRVQPMCRGRNAIARGAGRSTSSLAFVDMSEAERGWIIDCEDAGNDASPGTASLWEPDGAVGHSIEKWKRKKRFF